MKGIFLVPRDKNEVRSNWRLVSNSVVFLGGSPGGQEISGGTQSGDDLTLRSNPSVDGDIKMDLTTEDLDFVDAGSTGATEQDWVQVKVGGNTGYIRVYATK